MIPITEMFPTLTVEQALKALCADCRMGGKTFHMSFNSNACDVTIQDALEGWPDSWLGCFAYQFAPIRFYGGPPTKGQWFSGSIATLYYDALLFRQALRTPSQMPVLEVPRPSWTEHI